MQSEFFAPDSPVPAGDTPSWFTPTGIFLAIEEEAIRRGFLRGPIDLDPCGHHESPVSTLIALRPRGRVFSIETNGLDRWDRPELISPPAGGWRVFCNFPYDSESAAAFLARLAAARARGEARAVIAHAPAWTDRAWWQDHIEPDREAGRAIVKFHRGRLRYGWPGNPTGKGGTGAKFPSATIFWPERAP